MDGSFKEPRCSAKRKVPTAGQPLLASRHCGHSTTLTNATAICKSPLYREFVRASTHLYEGIRAQIYIGSRFVQGQYMSILQECPVTAKLVAHVCTIKGAQCTRSVR